MNEEAGRALGRYMVALCQSHTIHRWVANWEHELWDALISDGRRGHADPHESADRLTPEELLELRRLMKEAACWHFSPIHAAEEVRLSGVLWEGKGNAIHQSPDPSTGLLPISLNTWKSFHTAWLHTPGGLHNQEWRNEIYKTTYVQVEEIAEMRDRLIGLVKSPLTLGVQDERVIVDLLRSKRAELVLAWLPPKVRERLQVRWRPR